MIPSIPEAPWWVVVILVFVTGFATPWFTNRSARLKSDRDWEGRLRDDMRKEVEAARNYVTRVEAQVDALKNENSRLLTAVTKTSSSFNEFRMMMLREAIGISIALDSQDALAAAAKVDALIANIKRLRVFEDDPLEEA